MYGGEVVDRGVGLLDALKLREAEEVFVAALKQLQADLQQFEQQLSTRQPFLHQQQLQQQRNHLLWNQVECLVGIAESRVKRFQLGRYLKADLWTQCFIYPLLLLHLSVQRCDSLLQQEVVDVAKVKQKRTKTTYQIKHIEEDFVKGFIKKVFGRDDASTDSSNNNNKSKLNSESGVLFLESVLEECGRFVCGGFLEGNGDEAGIENTNDAVTHKNNNHDNNHNNDHNYNNHNNNNQKSNHNNNNNNKNRNNKNKNTHLKVINSDNNLRIRSPSQPPPSKNNNNRNANNDPYANKSSSQSTARILNFEKFQESIQAFVKEVSSDMRSSYGHLSKLPGTLMKQRLASEIALRLTPGSIKAEDYINVFETALVVGVGDGKEDGEKSSEQEECKDRVDDGEFEKVVAEMMDEKMRLLLEEDGEWSGELYSGEEEKEEDISDDKSSEDNYNGDEDIYHLKCIDLLRQVPQSEDCRCCCQQHQWSLAPQLSHIQHPKLPQLPLQRLPQPALQPSLQPPPQLQYNQPLLQQHQSQWQHLKQGSNPHLCDFCINSLCRFSVTKQTTFSKNNRIVLIWRNSVQMNVVNYNQKNPVCGKNSVNRIQRDQIHIPNHSRLSDLKELPNSNKTNNDSNDCKNKNSNDSNNNHINNNNDDNKNNNNSSNNNNNSNNNRNDDLCRTLSSHLNMAEVFMALVLKASDLEADRHHVKKSVHLLQLLENIIGHEGQFGSEEEGKNGKENGKKLVLRQLWSKLGERLPLLGSVSMACSYLQACLHAGGASGGAFARKSGMNGEDSGGMFSNGVDDSRVVEKAGLHRRLAEACLGQQVRQESLMAKFMLLVKQEIVRRQHKQTEEDNHGNFQSQLLGDIFEKSAQNGVKKEEEEEDDDDDCLSDSYLICLHEAINHLTTSATLLRPLHLSHHAEEWCDVMVRLADCHVMAGNLELAERCYDEVLENVRKTKGSDQLLNNTHAVLSLATLSFLSANHVRANTLLHTALALKGLVTEWGKAHDDNDGDDENDDEDGGGGDGAHDVTNNHHNKGDFSVVWNLMLTSFCQLHKPLLACTWLARSFRTIISFFNGILYMDSINRWFTTHILTTHAHCLIALSNPRVAVSKLTLAKNFLEMSPNPDVAQMSLVLKMLGDSYWFMFSKPNEEEMGEEKKVEVDETNGEKRKKNKENGVSEELKENYRSKSENFYRMAVGCLRRSGKAVVVEKEVQRLERSIDLFKKSVEYHAEDISIQEVSRSSEVATDESRTSPIHGTKPSTLATTLSDMADNLLMSFNLDQALACLLQACADVDTIASNSHSTPHSTSDHLFVASLHRRLGRLYHAKYLGDVDETNGHDTASLYHFEVTKQRIAQAANTTWARVTRFNTSSPKWGDVVVEECCMLYDCGRVDEALDALLGAGCEGGGCGSCGDELVYSGIEMSTLPELLRGLSAEAGGWEGRVVIERRFVVALMTVVCLRHKNICEDLVTEVVCELVLRHGLCCINCTLSTVHIHNSLATGLLLMWLRCYEQAFSIFCDVINHVSAAKKTKTIRLHPIIQHAAWCLLLHANQLLRSFLVAVLESSYAQMRNKYRLLTHAEFVERVFRGLQYYSRMASTLKDSCIKTRSLSRPSRKTAFETAKTPKVVTLKVGTGLKSPTHTIPVTYRYLHHNN